jgi:hypothetical protein
MPLPSRFMALQRSGNDAFGRARASRATPPLRRRALRALRLRCGFARGRIFPLALRFDLDGPMLRSVPSRPSPAGETKKFFRAPACCRALRPYLDISLWAAGLSIDAYSRMHPADHSSGTSVERGEAHVFPMLSDWSSARLPYNARIHFFSLLPAAFPPSADEYNCVHAPTCFRSAGREAARTSRRSSAQRSACGTLKKRIAAALILRFKKRCNSRIVRDDKVCVCRTAQPSAARSQTPLQGGSAPVDPRDDRSERTR